MIKDILLFRAEEKNNDKSPDFKLSTKIGEKFVNCGAGWNRKTKDGKPFISLKLSNPFKDFKGFHLEEDKPENQLELTPEEKNKVAEEEFIAL